MVKRPRPKKIEKTIFGICSKLLNDAIINASVNKFPHVCSMQDCCFVPIWCAENKKELVYESKFQLNSVDFETQTQYNGEASVYICQIIVEITYFYFRLWMIYWT